jgi:hypothetical protein
MSGFSADESASRAGLAASSGDTQSADSTAPASADVLLTADTADSSANGNAIDSALGVAEHGSAAAPIVTADSDVPVLSAALSDVSDDAGSGFHLSASADAFWFRFDDNGSARVIADAAGSAEDQAASARDGATSLGSGGEPVLTTQAVGLFHDASAVGQADSTAAGHFGSSSSAALGNLAAPVFGAGPDGF